ncbi:MAG: hypothetical protein DRQ55_07375 [Planctomycetota bacterium]|nr:MAG: hypothetical protein DRQ55_07375 [Planctomycetota bacterium]
MDFSGFDLSAPAPAHFKSALVIAPLLLAASFMALGLFSDRLKHARRRQLISLSGPLALPFLLMTLLGLCTTSIVASGDVVQWIEAGEPDAIGNPVNWARVETCLEHLRAAGVTAPELGPFQACVRAEIDSASARGEFNTLFALPVLRMGLERGSDLEAWRNPYRESRLMDAGAVRHIGSAFDEIALRVLDARRPLSAAERNRIAKRVVSSIEAPSGFRPIESCLRTQQVLDLLGRGSLGQPLGERAQAAMRVSWTLDSRGSQGAFVSDVVRQLRKDGTTSGCFMGGPSSSSMAILAMARWGVPDGIDLSCLERFLTAQCRTKAGLGVTTDRALAATALAHLRSLPEFVGRAPVSMVRAGRDILVEWYGLFLSLLLVALWAVLGIRRTRAARSSVPGGARRFSAGRANGRFRQVLSQ